MSFYSNLASTASRLLTKYGQTVVFTRTTGATFSPSTGAYSGGTTTTVTGVGATFPYNIKEIDGTLVQLGDVRVFFYATSAPLVGDNCAVDSVNYRVQSVEQLSPGGTVVLYTVQCRK